jgi:hypothetical protein
VSDELGTTPIDDRSRPLDANDAQDPAKRALSPAQRKQRQTAALRHGLRAKAGVNVRVRHYRAGHLLTRLQEVLTDLNRPLQEVELPAARAWCEHEVLAVDHYAALQSDARNPRLLEAYLAIRRAQLAYARDLGLTPGARAALGATVASGRRDSLVWQLAQARADHDAELQRKQLPKDGSQ